MKTRLVCLFALFCTMNLIAQVEWKGGFPGQENNWFCANNWSDNRIPDDFDNVIIPDVSTSGNHYPVIEDQNARVQSLELQSGAKIRIESGAQLSILGFGLPGGALLNLGAVENYGTLEVIEPVLHAVDYSGKGTLIQRRSNLSPDHCKCETTVCL